VPSVSGFIEEQPGVFRTGRLEDLSVGATVEGLLPDTPVSIRAIDRFGPDTLSVTYRTSDGLLGERLLTRGDQSTLRVRAKGRAWSFAADGGLYRLAAEARRIRLAHLFDPMLAVHLSSIRPLPHQVQAVYGELLPRQPLRFLLADDPGAGKTIMAGLYAKELLLRGDLARCLIVAPGGLVAQWQDELADKFGLEFDILSRDMIESSRSGNPFAERNLLLARLDQLSRNEDLQAKLGETDWDLIIVDEAHRMSAHFYGDEIEETKRYRLGKLLGRISRHFLLMTATPHSGKEEDFQLFLALLDADRFAGKFRDGAHTVDTRDLMRRMVKEKLLTFEGTPLFPERRATTVAYKLSDPEQRLYDEVTAYVVEEMNRAQRLTEDGEGRRGNSVGFALTILQRRLASSPAAIYESLQRRRRRLEGERGARQAAARGVTASGQSERLARLLATDDLHELFEGDELTGDEQEDLADEVTASASAARSLEELGHEIQTLTRLEELSRRVRDAGTDAKWAELRGLLDEATELRHSDGSRRKLIVFTEHRDTMDYLVHRLGTYLARPDAVVKIYGGTGREERRAIEQRFTQDPDCTILVATDAAGEGLNLQRAHLVINYDLPWNPNRIEQRFGRVHRIGQTEVCHLWNLVAKDTREGQVYLTLLAKVEVQTKAYGGQVFDVLGQAFEGRPLRDLLMQAIRYGDQPETRARLEEVIDATVGEGVRDLVAQRGLATEVMGQADVEAVRLRMEEASARRLQPHYVQLFFLAGFDLLGGRVLEREAGRFEVRNVPAELRARDRQTGRGAPLLARYERICFDPQYAHLPGKARAEVIAPGHPLLDVVLDLVSERHGRLLAEGTILVDDQDLGERIRVIVTVEHTINDARMTRDGQPFVVSRRMVAVELDREDQPTPAGPAPHLDLRPATEAERELLTGELTDSWLTGGLEAMAVAGTATSLAPEHLAEVSQRVVARVAKIRGEVKARLTREINHWDHRAHDLAEQELAGRQPRMNADRARQRADELESRLGSRLAELERQEQLQPQPPIVTGAALVVPVGLLAQLAGGPVPDHAADTAETDRKAVAAVLGVERDLHRVPETMPHTNPGYDVRSITSDGHLLLIEVKGRVVGASTVHVSKQQLLSALNAPERWILALVEIGPAGERVRYLRGAFTEADLSLHFAETGREFSWSQLWSEAKEPA